MATTDNPLSPNAKCTVCKPPGSAKTIQAASIFLAGSIERGKAIDWQTALTKKLEHLPITVFNPRRDDWDNSWEEDISNPQFKEQVDWELDQMAAADVTAVCFVADTSSPITLMELGLRARDGKVVVCCPKGFWKRGNVQVVCHRFGITLVDTVEELAEEAIKKLEKCMEERKGAVV
ncbi:uncharacterized protein BDZ99DRAFT_461225 [Mytilinidion resinicola]|uniref:Nucleoside 2-deoxyribosyltransferase domain-containing protein n=1 Tax=Mytilinidion resinicola TaxID=574789 RepID=A0A6A6YUW7_9PEZI|nr:uncharacterized protein BDZ99DRAFT_461225 [Mytilinidion resinicola]KAF2812560.1 hypothetical protein BDZ99DRAFT_461225 [Mytilinidion resinicola]